MRKLIDALLTTKGVVGFWLVSATAYIGTMWAVAPGRTLQDALTAEILQGHLAGGYQLRNPPLYGCYAACSRSWAAGRSPISCCAMR